VRRLYSTFAGGWPGLGLLLLRLVAGSALVVRAGLTLAGGAPMTSTVTAVFLAGSGILLIPGLWTPIAGTLVAMIELWLLRALAQDPMVSLLLGTIGSALAMLGPGVWSIDARLFGWKRVEPPPRHNSAKPG
jgi:hypothetical protein